MKAQQGGIPPAFDTSSSTRTKRNWMIALLVVVLVAAAGCGALLLQKTLSSKGTGEELVLNGATDPGANAFMPPAAPPPPTDTQPPPTLPPHGDDASVVTQPLPGDRDGLYGGNVNNAESDRETMITFLGAHRAQADAFVEALNTDSTLFWSSGRLLTVDDIPAYLRELTPVWLRLDTRLTNHGFDGTRLTNLQSVFQAGTGVLVDAHGVPRVRCNSGSPLTAPTALTGKPKLVGTTWPGYHPGALAEVQPSITTITTFVLLDVVTGRPFNRPAGTAGTHDTPHAQAVPPPQPPGSQTAPTTAQALQPAIDGTYISHSDASTCGGPAVDVTAIITHQGNALTISLPKVTYTGSLNADGSFAVTHILGPYTETERGIFAIEGGRTVIRNGTWEESGGFTCSSTFVATKQ